MLTVKQVVRISAIKRKHYLLRNVYLHKPVLLLSGGLIILQISVSGQLNPVRL